VPFEGGDRRELADAGGATRLLALDRVHRLDDVLGPDRPADSPAGHRVCLADAADRDRLFGEPGPKRREARRLRAAVDELFVDLVAEDADPLLQTNVGDRFQLGPTVDGAGRIAR